jgi:replicative DNA helicase
VNDRPLTEREPPYDLNAERALLGSILVDRDAIIVIAPWFEPDFFYLQKHVYIYEAMLGCYNHQPSIPPDLSTVSDELRRRKRLDLIGGIAYLGELSAEVPTAVHVEYYARIVERTALLRRLIQAGGKIATLGYDEHEDLEATLDRAEVELFSVSQNRTTQDFVHIGSVIKTYFDQLRATSEDQGLLIGVPTSYPDLDRLTGGLQRSDLIILAARPSVGKTAFALSMAYNVATHAQHTVAIFSLEMSREQLVQRLIAMHTGIDVQKLRTANLHDSELQHVLDAMGILAEAPIYIDDAAGLSIAEVRSKARRLQAQVGIDLIIVDYLQLMQSRRRDNRVQEVSEISRGMKSLAREINIPVIAISQLSRAVEGRTNHVPMLSDLRESGCLAGDTRIYLPDVGIYRRIDELEGQSGFNVLAANPSSWKLELRQVTRAFATGQQPVYRLTTRLGHRIRATANHRFLTITGWKRLDDLSPGMHVALPRHIPGPAQATMPQEELALLANVVQSSELLKISQSDLYWDEIVSLEACGVEKVYDLTVEGLHNFTAENMIVHNSIEQDADIVMFIYREELYDKDTDKKGIAEIHIAKHRNGPPGIIPLRFDANTTRFQNLERYRTPEGY